MRIGLTESRSVRGTEQAGGILIEQLFGPGAIPLPNIGSMDGDAGCSEGATAEKVVPFSCAVPRSQPFRSLCAPSAGRVECTSEINAGVAALAYRARSSETHRLASRAERGARLRPVPPRGARPDAAPKNFVRQVRS